jgi:hypothetical protein
MAFTVGSFDWPGGAQRMLAELASDGTPARPVILRGFNVSGAAKLYGAPFADIAGLDVEARAAQFLPALRDDGFDLLRVPIVWEFLQPNGPDDWNEDVACALREFVAYAGTLGFHVIVDVHQDVLSSYFHHPTDAEWRGDGLPEWLVRIAFGGDASPPREWADTILGVRQWAINYNSNQTMRHAMNGLTRDPVLAAFTGFAGRLRNLFAGLDNILTYEVLNEPFSQCLTAGAHAAIAAAFREGLGGALGRLCTPAMSVMPAGDWLDSSASLWNFFHPEVDSDVDAIASRSSLPRGPLQPKFPDLWLLTPHFYDPRAGSPDRGPEPDRYPAAIVAARRLFSEWNVAAVVGEFGCPSDEETRDACHLKWLGDFERNGWSWCHWNFNPDATGEEGDDHWCGEKYSVAYALGEGRVQRAASYRAFLRPFVRRCGGPILDTTWNPDNGTYTARIGRAYRAGWTTEIYVPVSLEGFRASGAGEVVDRTIVVDSDDGEKDVIIEVTVD